MPPDGLSFAPPLMNVGPDAGGKPDAAIGTFDPHSCPCGFIWIDGPAYPPADRGSFFVTRYGNLLAHKDCGFDLVRVRPLIGGKTVAVDKIVGPLARPIDILEYVPGRLLIAEYCRGTNFEAGLGQPGRILDLKVSSNQ